MSPRPASFFFFFFQAEDGIRDKLVTGVQTCALPDPIGDRPAVEKEGRHMLDTAITIAIELLFALVFVASLVDYLRRRDPLSRDLVLVFGSVAALFVVQFVGLIFGSTPPWLAAASAALILAQPLFTLRLAARIRRIPGAVVAAASVAYLLTAVPLVVLSRP